MGFLKIEPNFGLGIPTVEKQNINDIRNMWIFDDMLFQEIGHADYVKKLQHISDVLGPSCQDQ